MAWYKTGTVNVTNGSTAVVGTGTDFINGVGVGEAFLGPDGKVYEIAAVVSATSLTLGSNYLGTTQTAQAYQIVPTQSYMRDLAADAAALVSNYSSVLSNAGTGQFTDGTLAAPGIRFSGDTNTGIHRPAADTMKLVAGGTSRVDITTANTTVTNTLNIVPAQYTALTGAQTAADDDFLVYDTSAGALKRITRAELNNAMTSEALDTVDINGGTIDGVSIGSSAVATFLAVDNISIDANTIASTDANGNIVLAPNGTGDVQVDADTLRVGDANAAATITTNGTGNLTLSTNSGTNSGTIVINQGANGNIVVTPNGTGDVYLDADTVRIGDSNANATLTTNGTGDLILNTNAGTNSGSITIADAAGGDITVAPNGNGSVVITNTGTSNALRITQTGTGNALLVEDSTNPDSTPTVIDAAGRVVIGHTVAIASAVGTSTTNYSLPFTVAGTTNATATAAISTFSTSSGDSAAAGLSFNRSASATIGTQAVVASANLLGSVSFSGTDGTNYVRAALIEARVDGTPGTNDMPGRVIVSTTPAGSATPVERYRINNSGNHFFGNTTTNTNSTLMVVNGEISETSNGVQYKLVNQSDIGTGANEIPVNGMLGRMAFQSPDYVVINGGTAVLSSATATTLKVDTNITAVAPSLNLNFAKTKALDPRITFTRASTATYYDGSTTAKAEENLLTYSEQFDNAAWGVGGVTVTANSTAAPDGNTTADTLTANAANNGHLISFTIAAVAGVDRTFSVFAKKGTHDFIQFCVATDTGPYANFDIGTGVVGTKSGSVTSSITSMGNGWYRCSMTYQSSAGTAVEIQVAQTASAARRVAWTAVGTETVYVWGAQLEQRSSVTAYTATTTQAITNYIPVLQTAASGVARFDHDPVTRESKGLLIEEARTNLLTYSSEFDNAAWTKTNATITADAAVAPDGTLTADKGVENTAATTTHIPLRRTFTSSITTYTFSVYVKAAERSAFMLLAMRGDLGATTSADYDLVGVTATGRAAGMSSSSTISSVGNGWYRCTLTYTDTVGGASAYVDLRMSDSASSSGTTGDAYTGDGYSGIYVWGAQLEAGAFPTSYIPTTTASATRQADAASMTGANFTSWFNASEGTFHAVSQSNATGASFPQTYNISDGSTNNYINESYGSAQIKYTVMTGLVSQAAFTPAQATGALIKSAGAYANNDFAYSLAGAAALTDTSGTVPVVNLFRLGASPVGTNGFLNGHIKLIRYFPKRLADAELQEMTA